MLGSTIRSSRKAKGFTLQEVSGLTGLSVGFLCQVEHDQSTPSLASLRKIAAALDSSLFTLLAGEDGAATVIRRSERRRMIEPGSNVVHELLSPGTRTNRMELSCTVLGPGSRTRDRLCAHSDGEEFALVLFGQVTIELGAESFSLEEGDTIYFNCGIPHRYSNCGEMPASLLTAVTPPAS